MTASDFQRYLEQPRGLYELPLTDLQQLALRYPYSPNIRLLLLLKSHLEGHSDEDVYLNRCAAASFDRAFIYDLLREIDVKVEDQTGEGEFLELRELDDLALEAMPAGNVPMEEERPLEQTLPSPSFESDLEEDLEGTFDDDEGFFGEDPDFEEAEDETLVGAFFNDELSVEESSEAAEWVESTGLVTEEIEEIVEDGVLKVTPSVPVLPASAGGLRERLTRIRRRQEARSEDGSENVGKIARRSLVAQEVVASETLAKLLVRQGQYQNAIKMYRQLVLLYPDKKTTFAGLINNLKEKL